MAQFRIRTLLFMVGAMLALGLGAAGAQTVGMAIQDEPTSLDPVETIQLTAYQVLNYILEPLVYIGPDKQPHGWVAESWDVSAGGKVITFHIRHGRSFSDGTPVDANAVAFSFNRQLDPDKKSANRTGLGTLEKVDVVDPYTVRFTYKEPYAPVWTSLASPFYGIVSPTAAKKYGKDFGRNIVGSGPFKLVKWTPAVGFDLARVDDYTSPRIDVENHGPMHIAKLNIRILPEEGTRMAALQSGAIHYGDAPLEQVPSLENNPKFNVVINKQNNSFTMLEVDPFKAPTNDVAVRKAIAYSLNIADIMAVAYAGLGTPDYTPLPIGNTGYDAAIGEKYGYHQDLEKAAQILQDDGYTKSGGVWQKNGKPLTLAFWTYTLPNGTKGGQVIQQQLQQAGFKVDMQTFEVASMIAKLKEHQHNINFMWWSGWDPIFLSYVFHTPGWAGVYADPALDKILDQAATELDPAKRQQLTEQAEIYLLQNVGVIPIGTDWSVILTRSDLQGLKLDALGFILLNDARLVS